MSPRDPIPAAFSVDVSKNPGDCPGLLPVVIAQNFGTLLSKGGILNFFPKYRGNQCYAFLATIFLCGGEIVSAMTTTQGKARTLYNSAAFHFSWRQIHDNKMH